MCRLMMPGYSSRLLKYKNNGNFNEGMKLLMLLTTLYRQTKSYHFLILLLLAILLGGLTGHIMGAALPN